ncbi:hypothetical protein [Singapore grouper iridovirus]|nr:hypothetical protein [Singapore grouper iridovirus]
MGPHELQIHVHLVQCDVYSSFGKLGSGVGGGCLSPNAKTEGPFEGLLVFKGLRVLFPFKETSIGTGGGAIVVGIIVVGGGVEDNSPFVSLARVSEEFVFSLQFVPFPSQSEARGGCVMGRWARVQFVPLSPQFAVVKSTTKQSKHSAKYIVYF